MKLFHASLSALMPGEELVADEVTTYYPAAVAALETVRPLGVVSRATCVFATDDPAFAVYFVQRQKQCSIDSVNLYSVVMLEQHRSPVALVHAVQRRLERGQDAAQLLHEYWTPTADWKFWECFGPRLTVVEQCNKPEFNELSLGFRYGKEFDMAAEFGS